LLPLGMALAAAITPSVERRALVATADSTHRTPQLTIVVSSGRGGSTATCETLAVLGNSQFVGERSGLANELLGSNSVQMRQRANETSPTVQMANYFALQSALDPHAEFVGFKWKVDADRLSYTEQPFLAAWAWAAEHSVRVVFLTRNLLDVYLSKLKHSLNPHIVGHCFSNACLKGRGTEKIPTVNTTTIVEELAALDANTAGFRAALQALDVQYLPVTFEDLFAGEKAARHPDQDLALRTWNGVLGFLGAPPAANYASIGRAIAATGLVDTSTASQCEEMANPSEVRTALAGSPYESLFEC